MSYFLLFLLNDFVVVQTNNEQKLPNICKGNNLWFVVWEDWRTGNPDVWGRFVDFNFNLVGNEFSVYAGPLPQLNPTVAFLNNKYLVVWRHSVPSWIYHIYGQLLDSNGNLIGAPFIIGNVTNAETPHISAGEDKWLVVWSDYRNGELDVYAQTVDMNGNLIGANFSICQHTGEQIFPYASWDGKNWLIVWEDKRTDESDIYAQIVRGNGIPIGGNFLICGETNYQRYPKTSSNKSVWLVVWSDYRSGVKYEIYGKFVDTLGNPVGTEFLIASVNDGYYPQVLWDGQKWLVVWADDLSGRSKIFVQTINFMGIPYGAPIQISNSPNRAWYPSFSIKDDKYFVVWQDDRNGNWDIYGNDFTPARVEDETNKVGEQDSKVDIFDICGRHLHQSHNLPTGIYFLKIKEKNDKATQYKKIIILR